jgi:FAD synthetase
MKSIKNVKDAKLGRHDNDTLKTVEELNPDIILLGPDQKVSLDRLQNALKMKGMNHIEVKRLEEFYDKYKLHSSSLIKKKVIEKHKKDHS